MDFTLTLAITVYHKPHHNEIFDSFHLFSTLFFGFDYLLYLLFPLFIFLSLVWILLLHSTHFPLMSFSALVRATWIQAATMQSKRLPEIVV